VPKPVSEFQNAVRGLGTGTVAIFTVIADQITITS